MEAGAKRRRSSVNEERETLNHGLYSFLEDMALVSLDAGEPGTPIDELTSFDAIAHELKGVERRNGIQLEPGSKTYQLMGQATVRALIAAAEGRLRALEGKPSDPPATFLGAQGIDSRTLRPIVALPRKVVRIRTGGGMHFSEAAARYIEAKRKAGKITAHTQRQRETVFGLFKSFTNDAPLAAIDKLTATDFDKRGTSELGHTRRFCDVRDRSALPNCRHLGALAQSTLRANRVVSAPQKNNEPFPVRPS